MYILSTGNSVEGSWLRARGIEGVLSARLKSAKPTDSAKPTTLHIQVLTCDMRKVSWLALRGTRPACNCRRMLILTSRTVPSTNFQFSTLQNASKAQRMRYLEKATCKQSVWTRLHVDRAGHNVIPDYWRAVSRMLVARPPGTTRGQESCQLPTPV